jgi:hypothetical protein
VSSLQSYIKIYRKTGEEEKGRLGDRRMAVKSWWEAGVGGECSEIPNLTLPMEGCERLEAR